MKRDENFEIQQILDQKIRFKKNVSQELIKSEDVKAYEFIYAELAKEPKEGLPMAFKANVMRDFEIQKKKESDWAFYLVLLIVSFVGILSVALTISVFREAFAPIFIVLERFKGVIVVGLAALVAFYLLENKSISSNRQSFKKIN